MRPLLLLVAVAGYLGAAIALYVAAFDHDAPDEPPAFLDDDALARRLGN